MDKPIEEIKQSDVFASSRNTVYGVIWILAMKINEIIKKINSLEKK